MEIRRTALALAGLCVLSSFGTHVCSPIFADVCGPSGKGGLQDLPEVSWDEVKANNNEQSCWTVIDGVVVNVTEWLHSHPGGKSVLLKHAGGDSTEAFTQIHLKSPAAKQKLLSLAIGIVPNLEGGIQETCEKQTWGDDKEQDATRISLQQYSMEEVQSHNDEQSCWVVIDGFVVDATLFLNKHPGGASRISNMAGKDATDAFTTIGHSNAAKKLVAHYAIGTVGNTSIIKPSVSEDELHGDWLSANFPLLSRLNSGHDKKHMHKLLGGMTAASYAWRLVIAVGSGFTRFTMSRPTIFNVATLSLHMALPLSALQFEVPKMKKQFNIIYDSRRLEIILFCTKYASATALRWYSPAGADLMLKFAHVVAMHIIIDLSNQYYNPHYEENGTPVRGTKKTIWGEHDKETWERVFARAFHHFGPMFSQTLAVMMSLDLVSSRCDPRAVIDTMFWALLPIQGHAFTSTLVRKNILVEGLLNFSLYGIMLLPGSANAIFNGGGMLLLSTFTYMFLRCVIPHTPVTKYGIYVFIISGATWIRRRSEKAKGD
mmetsp:Transcript_49899/g.160352  ORF Transcript_49899/g.160352 Transcript_49899/m.160352 type:complete len:544 (+) Transcript_49899:105-1736(+)